MVLGKNIAHDMKSGAEGAHFFGALLLTFSFDKHSELERAKHEKEYTRITDVSVAICRLIIKLQNTQFDFPAFLDSECAYIRENLTVMSDLSVYVLEALAKCCDAVYNLGMNIVVSFAKNCVESFESDENTELQIRYLCFLKKIFKKRNEMQQLRAITK